MPIYIVHLEIYNSSISSMFAYDETPNESFQAVSNNWFKFLN